LMNPQATRAGPSHPHILHQPSGFIAMRLAANTAVENPGTTCIPPDVFRSKMNPTRSAMFGERAIDVFNDHAVPDNVVDDTIGNMLAEDLSVLSFSSRMASSAQTAIVVELSD
jgi:hypothetical protein